MKSNGLLGIVLLVGVVGLLGCKPTVRPPSQITIAGQVFIVTKGAENLKLGGVQVLLIDKQQVVDFLRGRQPDIDAQITTRQKAVYDASAALDAARSNLLAVRSNANAAWAAIPTTPDYLRTNSQIDALVRKSELLERQCDLLNLRIRRARPGSPDWVSRLTLVGQRNAVERQLDSLDASFDSLTNQLAEIDRHVEAEQTRKVSAARAAVTNAETAELNLRISLNHFPATADYMEGFAPLVVRKTVSDADGRFSISYPLGKAFTFYASAQRQLPQRTEHYCWLVDAPTNSEIGSFVLSVGNLTVVDPDGYFEHKPQEPEPSSDSP